MDVRATRVGSAGLIWGGAVVLAWAAFTLFTGGGSAHAAEGDDPLDSLTGLVGDAVSTVTAPVTPAVAPVVAEIAPPVQQAVPAVVTAVAHTVAQVPVVGPATAPVVDTVTDTAQQVAQSAVDVAESSAVSGVTAPVLDLVTGLPVVGHLIDDLGVAQLIDDVVGTADDATGVVGGVLDGTVNPAAGALEPLIPRTDGQRPIASTSASVSDTDAAIADPRHRVPALVGAVAAGANGDTGAPPRSGDPAAGPPATPVSPSSSAGSSGGAITAAARISDDGVSPLRAEKRKPGAPDDALPASPVADTDVSPD